MTLRFVRPPMILSVQFLKPFGVPDVLALHVAAQASSDGRHHQQQPGKRYLIRVHGAGELAM